MEETAGSMESQHPGQQDLWQAGGLGDPLGEGGQPCLDLRRGPQNFILPNNLKLPQSSAPTPSLQRHPVWRRPQAG